jgi:hypothetical protein
MAKARIYYTRDKTIGGAHREYWFWFTKPRMQRNGRYGGGVPMDSYSLPYPKHFPKLRLGQTITFEQVKGKRGRK